MNDFKPVATWQQAVGLAVMVLVVVAVANRVAPIRKVIGH